MNIIWGGGKACEDTIHICNRYGIEIDYIVDVDKAKNGKVICGIQIIVPEELPSEFFTIYVSSVKHQDSIIALIKDLNIHSKIITRYDLLGEKSYSEMGEDVIINRILERNGIVNPFYMDIGMPDGYSGSNTRLLYDKGANGIIIEANPDCYDGLIRTRPNDKVLNIGVCGEGQEGILKYYRFKNNRGLNTFSEQCVQERIKSGITVDNIIDIECHSLRHIMEEHQCCPDVVSIDVEGMEEDILKDFPFDKYPVKIWCIEKSSEEIPNIMKNNGYVKCAETMSNWIYVLVSVQDKINNYWIEDAKKRQELN